MVGPHDDSKPLRVDLSHDDPGVLAGERTGGDAQLRIARHDLQALAVGDELLGVKTADFPKQLGGDAGQVRLRHGPKAALTRQQRVPKGRPADTEGADKTYPRDYYVRCLHPTFRP